MNNLNIQRAVTALLLLGILAITSAIGNSLYRYVTKERQSEQDAITNEIARIESIIQRHQLDTVYLPPPPTRPTAKPTQTAAPKKAVKKIIAATVKEPISLFANLIYELKRREAYMAKPYYDISADVPTQVNVGWGTMHKAKRGKLYTPKEAQDILYKHIDVLMIDIAKDFGHLPRHKQLAILSLSYNTGLLRLKLKYPTFYLQLKNSKGNTAAQDKAIAKRFTKYCRYRKSKTSGYIVSANLLRSRQFEAALWLNDVATVDKLGEQARLESVAQVAKQLQKYPKLKGSYSSKPQPK